MAESVTPEYLLKGAVYALEQCGVLLRDAALLHQNGAYASAVVLAAFAREALGQWKILLDRRKEMIGGKTFTIAEIKTSCGKHIEKQQAGMLSITMRADRDSDIGQLLMSRIAAQSGTEEATKTDEALARLYQQMKEKEQVPSQRHEKRMVALYIDPIEPLSADRWNRPSKEITKEFSQNDLNDARNDYAGQLENRYNNFEILKDLDEELCTALEQWSDRPIISISEVPVLWG